MKIDNLSIDDLSVVFRLVTFFSPFFKSGQGFTCSLFLVFGKLYIILVLYLLFEIFEGECYANI